MIYHCLLINENDTLFYRNKNKKVSQRVWNFVRNISDKHGEKWLDIATKIGLDALKTVF